MQIAIASQKKFHVSKKNAYKKNAFLGGKISIENRLLENALVFFENTEHWWDFPTFAKMQITIGGQKKFHVSKKNAYR